jgi:hypothetical protein
LAACEDFQNVIARAWSYTNARSIAEKEQLQQV